MGDNYNFAQKIGFNKNSLSNLQKRKGRLINKDYVNILHKLLILKDIRKLNPFENDMFNRSLIISRKVKQNTVDKWLSSFENDTEDVHKMFARDRYLQLREEERKLSGLSHKQKYGKMKDIRREIDRISVKTYDPNKLYSGTAVFRIAFKRKDDLFIKYRTVNITFRDESVAGISTKITNEMREIVGSDFYLDFNNVLYIRNVSGDLGFILDSLYKNSVDLKSYRVNSSNKIKSYSHKNLCEEYTRLTDKYKKGCFPVFLYIFLIHRKSKKRVYKEVPVHMIKDKGYTIKEVEEILQNLDVSYYMYDSFFKKISSFSSKKKKYYCLRFIIANNHIYPVIDLSSIKEIKDKTNLKYVKFEQLKHDFDRQIDNGIIPVPHLIINNKVISYDDKKGYDDETIKAWNICDILGKEREDKLHAILWDQRYKFPASCLNMETECLVRKNRIDLTEKIFKEHNGDWTKLDICKQFSSILINKKSWASFGPECTIKKFTGIKSGHDWYFGRIFHPHFTNTTMFSGETLKMAVDKNIKVDIKYELKHSFSKHSDIGHIISSIYRLVGPEAKDAVNYFIGMLNKKSVKYTKQSIVGKSDAERLVVSDKDIVINKYRDLYVASKEKNRRIRINYNMIYLQILDYAKRMTFENVLKYNAFGSMADCVYVPGKVTKLKDKKDCELGELGIESYQDVPCSIYNTEHTFESDMIVTSLKKGNCHNVIGNAGTGKSYYCLKNYDGYIRTSYTNAACVRIKGDKTITRMFGIDNSKDLEKWRGSKIFVDEVYCVPIYFMYIFYILHTYYNVHFVFAGDPNQLLMDMDKGTSTYNTLKEIVRILCSKTVILKKQWRFTDKLKDIIKPVGTDMTKLKKIRESDIELDLNNRHIVWYNKKRREINRLYRKLSKHPDAPYIATKTTKNYAKNEFFKYKDIKNKKMSNFELAFAFTVYKTQGLTIKKRIYIHEADVYCDRAKYVAVSRGVKYDNVINVVN
jgi:hypothetical protein